MVKTTYVQDLVNVLLFQIRPRYHSAVKIDFSFEAHFTQPHVSGLHVMDGSGYSNIIQSRLCAFQLWRCGCVCVCVLLLCWPHSWVILQELCQLLHTFGLYGATQQGLCVGIDEEGWHGAQQGSNAKGTQAVVVRVTWEHTQGQVLMAGCLASCTKSEITSVEGANITCSEQISHAFCCIPAFHLSSRD